MSWLELIKGTVMRPRISDADIELLLSRSATGSDETADLEIFISRLSGDLEPSRDPGHIATALAATVRASRPAPRPSLRRVMALAASLAVLFAFSTVAMAADGAVPGDPLYNLDRTLELVGIGDGGVDERIVEFDTLIQRGEDELAFDLLDEFAETANEDDATKAQRHIELAATKSNSIAAAAQERVAEMNTFIEENQGNGIGADRNGFGQGVSELARSGSNGATPNENAKGNSGNVTQGPPDHAASGGNQEDPPGQSGETGPPANPNAGNAGQSNDSGNGDTDRGNGGNTTSSGNSGNGNAGGNGNGPAQNSGKSDS